MTKTIIGAFIGLLALASLGIAPALAGEVVAQGTFEGASGHSTSGRVTIEQDGDGYIAILQGNFDFDGAPDPKLGFGKNGSYDGSSKIAHLGKLKGYQVYKIPAGIDVGAYDEFYVWCEKYSVPLGVAKLR